MGIKKVLILLKKTLDYMERYNDAEQTIMREANEKNAEILAMGASRPMCPRCQEVAIKNDIIDRMVTELK